MGGVPDPGAANPACAPSMYLDVEWTECTDQADLQWSPVVHWPGGVDRYEVWATELDANGVQGGPQLLGEVPGGLNYFLHTGHNPQGRPSMGAWVGYGLGSESQDLPGYVVLNGGLVPPGGLENFGSGFLPASYQGSVFKPSDVPLANIKAHQRDGAHQRRKLDLLSRLDSAAVARDGGDDGVESAIRNYELAFRMQAAVPELVELSGETEATRRLYGFEAEDQKTQTYARQCLLARRLVERGVRFVELTCPHVGHDRWDQHGNLKKGHEDNARAVDQPIAGLLADLEARGLLESTLVVWAGEFGRTPMAQGSNGRDHNPCLLYTSDAADE